MKSSDKRDKCIPVTAQALAKSINKSRSLTASMLFWVMIGQPSSSTKPNFWATNKRSMGKVLPAIAPEPRGQILAESHTFEKRFISLTNISTYANK